MWSFGAEWGHAVGQQFETHCSGRWTLILEVYCLIVCCNSYEYDKQHMCKAKQGLSYTPALFYRCSLLACTECLLRARQCVAKGYQGRERQMSSLTSWKLHTGHLNSIKTQLKKQKRLEFAFSAFRLISFFIESIPGAVTHSEPLKYSFLCLTCFHRLTFLNSLWWPWPWSVHKRPQKPLTGWVALSRSSTILSTRGIGRFGLHCK